MPDLIAGAEPARGPRGRHRRATSSTSSADPEHEQAMLELTQYALRSPERASARRSRSTRATSSSPNMPSNSPPRRRARSGDPGRPGRARARRVHRRTHPHLARRSRRRRRQGGRSCGRRRPLENGRPPMTSLDCPTVPGHPDARPAESPPSASRTRRVSAGWIAAFATVWLGDLDGPADPGAAPAAGADRRRSCTPRTGSTASSRSA